MKLYVRLFGSPHCSVTAGTPSSVQGVRAAVYAKSLYCHSLSRSTLYHKRTHSASPSVGNPSTARLRASPSGPLSSRSLAPTSVPIYTHHSATAVPPSVHVKSTVGPGNCDAGGGLTRVGPVGIVTVTLLEESLSFPPAS